MAASQRSRQGAAALHVTELVYCVVNTNLPVSNHTAALAAERAFLIHHRIARNGCACIRGSSNGHYYDTLSQATSIRVQGQKNAMVRVLKLASEALSTDSSRRGIIAAVNTGLATGTSKRYLALSSVGISVQQSVILDGNDTLT